MSTSSASATAWGSVPTTAEPRSASRRLPEFRTATRVTWIGPPAASETARSRSRRRPKSPVPTTPQPRMPTRSGRGGMRREPTVAAAGPSNGGRLAVPAFAEGAERKIGVELPKFARGAVETAARLGRVRLLPGDVGLEEFVPDVRPVRRLEARLRVARQVENLPFADPAEEVEVL